jgi:hypothetical protein
MHGWYYLAPQDDNVETLHQIHLHHREPGYIVNRTFLVPPSLPLQYVASLLAVLTGPFFHGLFSYLSLPSDCHLDDFCKAVSTSRDGSCSLQDLRYMQETQGEHCILHCSRGEGATGKGRQGRRNRSPRFGPGQNVRLPAETRTMPSCSLFIPRG